VTEVAWVDVKSVTFCPHDAHKILTEIRGKYYDLELILIAAGHLFNSELARMKCPTDVNSIFKFSYSLILFENFPPPPGTSSILAYWIFYP